MTNNPDLFAERWVWHQLQIQRGATGPLHVFMHNADPDQLDTVSIYNDPINMNSANETEDHEMEFVQNTPNAIQTPHC